MFTVRCPAKVNLFLAVGPPHRNGYHPLRTVFQAVGLYDTLEAEIIDGPHEVRFVGAEVPAENTVTKTLRYLNEIAPLPGLRITVTKHIPMESGLGGGSSNAAGVLRLAKKLVKGNIPDGELASIALAVGADVPFFLTGGRARAEGYGERLTPLPDAPEDWLVIVRPNVGCPTGAAYRALDALTYEWRDFPADDTLYNDFERVAPCECLDLLDRLRTHGARDAALSGSGSAVFGRFHDEALAHRAAAQMKSEGFEKTWAAPTLGRTA